MAGGMGLRLISNRELDDNAASQRQETERAQQAPVIQNLSSYIWRAFDSAREFRNQELDTRMLKSLRQRLGQYEPDMLATLESQGGTQIFMHLTQTKCRGAEAWMRDILMSTGMVPWDLAPTPVADLSPTEIQTVMQQIGSQIAQMVSSAGVVPTQEQLEEVKSLALGKIRAGRQEEAQKKCDAMKDVISDQLVQGNMICAIDAFITDLTTYPFACIKGPVVTVKPFLTWGQDMQSGKVVPMRGDKLTPWITRVSPFDLFWEPGIQDIQNGYVLERHELSRSDVSAMIGQPGYDEAAVRLALYDYEQGMLNDWLDMSYQEWERKRLEYRNDLYTVSSPAPVFKALEFSGSVSGRMLKEWGMDGVEDDDQEYEVNAWLIGRHVVRAVMNADPLTEKPYHIACFNKVPGSVVGISLPELIQDTQAVCNAAARAIVNNMAIASGPQVEVNIDRLPANEEVTEMYPWKIWQTLNDPLGTTAPALRFNQPSDNSASLMQVFDKFSRQADEESGIPAYTYGDTDIQGAGRTASGLSMLMGSAGKGIRQIITQIDVDVIQPLLRQLYRWNMKYNEDESIKGDADVVAKGTASLVKEQLNMRRVEFLQATANPIDAQIVGPKGRAYILREVAKGLEMDVDKIIPSEDELNIMQDLARQLQMQQARLGAMPPPGAQGGQPAAPSGRPAAAQMDAGARVA